MHILMNSASTQNCTHSGSVRDCDVGNVFSDGNIRERCTLLMNMLCHDKKHCVMEWIFRQSNSVIAGTSCLPLCLNHSQVLVYKKATVLTSMTAITKLNESGNRPCQNDRFTRPLYLQHAKALSVQQIVPTLSWRETALIDETRARAYGMLFPDNFSVHFTSAHVGWCHLASSRNPAPVHQSGTNERKALSAGFNYSRILQHASQHEKPVPPRSPHPARHNSAEFLPWLTGRMCWVMMENSPFLLHAQKHRQEVICGPSGHTDALLTFMKIFRNFDIEKWTLLCVVWLVGADHHSVYEVLVAAACHGLPFDLESNSVDFTRALLCKIGTKHKKSQGVPVIITHRAGATVNAGL